MRLMYVILAAIGFTAPAAAQNNFAAQEVIHGVSADKILEMFRAAGMSGSLAGASGGDQLVELRSSEGFVMYVSLSGCSGQIASSPCSIVKPYAIFNDALPLEFINQFNFSAANVSTLMRMPDERALLGLKVFLEGGVTLDNLRTYFGHYLLDAVLLLEGPQDNAATNVVFHPLESTGPAPGAVPASSAQANAAGVGLAGAKQAAAALTAAHKAAAED